MLRLYSQLCLLNGLLIINNVLYSKKLAAPIRGPLSRPMANLVMNFVLDSVKFDLSLQFKFIYKYVDDLVLPMPINIVDFTLKKLHDFNPYIQFTVFGYLYH